MMLSVVLGVALLRCAPLSAAPSWVEKSNAHAKVLLDTMAKVSPESSSHFGIEGLDEQIGDISAGARERALKMTREAELRRRLADERDPNVRQDLETTLCAAEDNIRNIELAEKCMLPYPRVAQMVFGGLRLLLDDQVRPCPPPGRSRSSEEVRRYGRRLSAGCQTGGTTGSG
jgi:hypothetical protein